MTQAQEEPTPASPPPPPPRLTLSCFGPAGRGRAGPRQRGARAAERAGGHRDGSGRPSAYWHCLEGSGEDTPQALLAAGQAPPLTRSLVSQNVFLEKLKLGKSPSLLTTAALRKTRTAGCSRKHEPVLGSTDPWENLREGRAQGL